MKHRHTTYIVENEYVFKRHQKNKLIEAYQIISEKLFVGPLEEINHGKAETENSSSLCSSLRR